MPNGGTVTKPTTPVALSASVYDGASFQDFLAALHVEKRTGALTVVLHLKNGVPQAIDVGAFRRIRLTPPK